MISMTVLTQLENNKILVRSPAVGFFSFSCRHNSRVDEGSLLGILTVLNRNYQLLLPEGTKGWVNIEKSKDKGFPVGYGQQLFTLIPEQDQTGIRKLQSETPDTEDYSTSDGEVVTSFTNGIFYRRPSPDAPAYVQAGDEIGKGKVLGLIEVMKTFNQIIFQGMGTGDNQLWRIKKVLAEDSQEVKSGEPLFLLEKMKHKE